MRRCGQATTVNGTLLNRARRSSPLVTRCGGRSTPAVTPSGLRVPAHRLPPTMTACGSATTTLGVGQSSVRRPMKARSAYKHVPHRDKPPHLVARRNARERRRVQAVNSAFLRLRRHLPHPVVGKHKRLSKVKTLRCAIDYISHLQRLLHDDELTTVSDDYVTQQQQHHVTSSTLPPHDDVTSPSAYHRSSWTRP